MFPAEHPKRPRLSDYLSARPFPSTCRTNQQDTSWYKILDLRFPFFVFYFHDIEEYMPFLAVVLQQ